jgi:hypothetical protein
MKTGHSRIDEATIDPGIFLYTLFDKRGPMKTGIIVYIAGGKDPGQEVFDPASVKYELPLADLYRIADSEDEIVTYWWELTAKGMHRILCQVARLDTDNTVRVTERSMRLSG